MGFGAGVTRRGQVHSEVVALSGEYVALSGQDVSVASQSVSCSVKLHVWRVSPTVGKFFVIISNAMQVSRLRKSLSELLVTYTICRLLRVLPDGDLPENLRMTAPRMLIRSLFTACICIVTGIRSLTQAEATDDFHASQAALAACVGHSRELRLCRL